MPELPNPICEYNITSTTYRHNYDVTSTDGKHLFHGFNAVFAIGKPSLTLFASTDTSGPVVGIAKNTHFSSPSLDFGLVDQSQPDQIAWESMVNTDWKSVKYVFRMDLGDGKALRLTWRKKGKKFEMVENETEEVLAVYSPAGKFTLKKTDHLRIYVDHGERFNLLTLLSGLAMREKQRRPTHAGEAGGGAYPIVTAAGLGKGTLAGVFERPGNV